MDEITATIKNRRSLGLEDITSQEFLDVALKNAVEWCKGNLHKHIEKLSGEVDYAMFKYAVVDKLVSFDMCLDEQNPGLILISADKLKWYEQRESYFEEQGMRRSVLVDGRPMEIFGSVEIDPESMFVHEITEFIASKDTEVFLHYISRMEFPHDTGTRLENINRLERGLEPWPEY